MRVTADISGPAHSQVLWLMTEMMTQDWKCMTVTLTRMQEDGQHVSEAVGISEKEFEMLHH